eukprot:XP_001705079.1 Hypothetical protein GL50803_118654 [Giardia lamblia ATCC 50803]
MPHTCCLRCSESSPGPDTHSRCFQPCWASYCPQHTPRTSRRWRSSCTRRPHTGCTRCHPCWASSSCRTHYRPPRPSHWRLAPAGPRTPCSLARRRTPCRPRSLPQGCHRQARTAEQQSPQES